MAPPSKFSSPLSVGRTVAVDSLKNLQPPYKRASKYREAMDAIRALKPGEATLIHRPQNISCIDFKLLIQSALMNFHVRAPGGYYFRKRFNEDNDLVVMVVRRPK